MKKIVLDNNNITQIGLFNMLDNTAQNTVLRTISVKNCKVRYDEDNRSEWKMLLSALSHNCGIIQIHLEGNNMPEELNVQILNELEMNQDIVDVIFPVIEQREL